MADAKPTATYVNLDAQCARYAALIEGEIRPKDASKLEILARNGLGVLREQGIYALFMYLRYRGQGRQTGGLAPHRGITAGQRDQLVARRGRGGRMCAGTDTESGRLVAGERVGGSDADLCPVRPAGEKR